MTFSVRRKLGYRISARDMSQSFGEQYRMLKEEYRAGNTNTDMIIMSISDILRSSFIRMIIKFIPQQVDCENRDFS